MRGCSAWTCPSGSVAQEGDFGFSAIVAEEQTLANDTASAWIVHSPIGAHYINTYGTEDQKQRWLPKVISGEAVLAIAMTEPGAGSDLQGIRTTAVRDGSHYVINGSKTFISNGSHCDLLIIVTKTDPAAGAAGVSLIVAETDDNLDRVRARTSPGEDRPAWSRHSRVVLLGHARAGGEPARRQGRAGLLSADGTAGARAADHRRASAPAWPKCAVLEAIRYTKHREAFGRPLIKFQHNRFELAQLKAETLSIKTTVDLCIQQYIDGNNDPAIASMAKLIAADKAVDVVDRCLQFFGGYGYMMEYPIARAYAAARVTKIYGGTSEIMKEIISRSL